MKNCLYILPILLFGCGESKEKVELDKLRDSIMIVNHGGTIHSEPSAEEKAGMEENARRTADSIAAVIEASTNEKK